MEILLLISAALISLFLIAIYGVVIRIDQRLKDMREVGAAIVYGEQKIVKAIEDLLRQFDVKKH